jgi:hypothetical protein
VEDFLRKELSRKRSLCLRQLRAQTLMLYIHPLLLLEKQSSD